MADKLVTVYENYRFYVQWELDGGDDMGAVLGEGGSKDHSGPPPTERGNWEHWTATKTLSQLPGVEHDSKGFFFDSKSAADKARAAANLAMKQDRELPDWAKTALAAGWKAPKGWKA